MRPRDSKTPPSAANSVGSANAPNARRARRSPFNREYQRRAARIALSRVACEVIEDPNSGFYRPAYRPIPKAEKSAFELVEEAQLALDFEVRDPAKPLADLFPEAYDAKNGEVK